MTNGGETIALRITTLTPDDLGYAELIAELSAEPLRTQWLEDAESEAEAGTSYAVVFAEDGAGKVVPAAWAGWRIVDVGGEQQLQCCSNYVRHGFRDRRPELYGLAYRLRHGMVVTRVAMRAFTFLYRQPIPLHLADGWTYDTPQDAPGTSVSPGGQVHHWWRLVRV